MWRFYALVRAAYGQPRDPPESARLEVIFASVLLLVIGCFNLIYGIAAIANSHVFTAYAHYVVGNLRAWGWITLIVAVLQLIAGAGIVAGNQLARWFAVAVLALSAIDMTFFIPAYPFWASTGSEMPVAACKRTRRLP